MPRLFLPSDLNPKNTNKILMVMYSSVFFKFLMSIRKILKAVEVMHTPRPRPTVSLDTRVPK